MVKEISIYNRISIFFANIETLLLYQLLYHNFKNVKNENRFIAERIIYHLHSSLKLVYSNFSSNLSREWLYIEIYMILWYIAFYLSLIKGIKHPKLFLIAINRLDLCNFSSNSFKKWLCAKICIMPGYYFLSFVY